MAAQMTSGKPSQKGKSAKLQAIRQGPVAIMYQAIATGNEVPAEHLEVGSRELAVLNRMRGPSEPRQMVRPLSASHEGDCHVANACPGPLWGRKNNKQPQLTWYWPGLTSTVRQLVKRCEVC